MKYLPRILITLFVVYIVFAYITLEFNPLNFDEFYRFVFVVVCAFSSLVVYMFSKIDEIE